MLHDSAANKIPIGVTEPSVTDKLKPNPLIASKQPTIFMRDIDSLSKNHPQNKPITTFICSKTETIPAESPASIVLSN